MKNSSYIRTDLATESPIIEKEQTVEGISVSIEKNDKSEISIIDVLNTEGEKQLGKPMGTYITVSFGKVWNLLDNDFNSIINTVSEKIRQLTNKHLQNKQNYTILVAGLGNRYITPDAIGPLTVKGITVTRHIKDYDKNLFKMLEKQSIAAISPGVLGQTGIETYELIKSASDSISPDLIIVVDALASKSVDRLATTIQICDTGIAPGSGIGNKRKAINQNTLGVPVIAIGVPTMVSSSTLVYDALEKAEVYDISDELTEVLENGKSFFVTLNESDTVVSSLSNIISKSINNAFSN